VNKYKFTLPINNDQELVIPIEIDWDFTDKTDALAAFETNAIKEILNGDKDFEVERFAHEGIVNQYGYISETDVNYEFYFTPSSNVNNAFWAPSYTSQGFTNKEIYTYANSFKKSFFKLDLYDSTDLKTQTIYATIIIPTQQGTTTPATVDYQVVNIKQPIFQLDYLGDKEGFFIYWLKSRDFLNIDTFYMTAKFFDGKSGIFVKMMNRNQDSINGNKYNFPQEKYFYYKVALNYSNFTYKIYDISSNIEVQVGDKNNPIRWYEYINP
jgi:hypothetical protein